MNIPKIIVRYLPQFHQIPENDKWWGVGFTEWTAVSNAKSLYEGHRQPRQPLNNNYYNLLEKKVMKWQADLGREYGIGGFSFYHYWFKDGKKILEKPAENLLEWKDINMPFCFTWANETWARSWSNLSKKNAWAGTYEDTSDDFESDGILLEQTYGDRNAWREHFEYLLPFFRDKRYLKKDNKPIFILYKPEDILCLTDMTDYWNELIKEYGFDGIYFIGETWMPYIPLDGLDAKLVRYPTAAFDKIGVVRKEKFRKLNYDLCWKITLKENCRAIGKKNVYICGFVDFDDTPRHGNRGTLLEGQSAEKFEYYLRKLIENNIQVGNEYVFLNAWNEWGEGMYLEPDVKNQYSYLEAVKKALAVSNLQDNDEDSSGALNEKRIEELQKDNDIIQKKLYYTKRNYEFLNKWLTLKEMQIKLETYFKNNKWETIAIYGFGIMGKHLLEELKNSDIVIKYIIDRNAKDLKSQYPLFEIEDNLAYVDAVVITPIYEYAEIKKSMRQVLDCPMISLEKIILEL